ncbi:MAG: peptidylprolyl isomerase, partial [Trueperaceae bacterium]
TASLIHDFFKPSILEQLIDRRLALHGAPELDATFFGNEALIAQTALDWVARDAEASEEQIGAYYQANLERYTVPASAEVVQVEFSDENAAFAYRDALLEGADPTEAAAEVDAEVVDHGTVGEGQLEGPLDTALFATDAFEPLPGGPRTVSDVLVLERPVDPDEPVTAGPEVADEAAAAAADAADADAAEEAGDPAAEPALEARHVVLVAIRTPAETLPLEQVRSDVEQTVRSQERQRLQRAWLDDLREQVEVEIVSDELDAALDAPGEATPGSEAPVDGGDGVELELDVTDEADPEAAPID